MPADSSLGPSQCKRRHRSKQGRSYESTQKPRYGGNWRNLSSEKRLQTTSALQGHCGHIDSDSFSRLWANRRLRPLECQFRCQLVREFSGAVLCANPDKSCVCSAMRWFALTAAEIKSQLFLRARLGCNPCHSRLTKRMGLPGPKGARATYHET